MINIELVSSSLKNSQFLSPGSSVVEHVPEEHSVDGSIPSLGTSLRSLNFAWHASFL